MITIEIGGIEIPDAGPVFLGVLGLHVVVGATAVVAGALAALARKRPGRHPVAGRVFLAAIVGVWATAAVMAVIRWRHDWPLLLIASVALALTVGGVVIRRRRRPHWMRWHGAAMSGAYVTLFTGFYVDNGPQLPGWDKLPHLSYWFIPTAVGLPLTVWALVRNGALGRGRSIAGSGGQEPPTR